MFIFFPQDKISSDFTTHGAMLVPVILGSDKTTVSVATGHQEYHPVYVSIGNVHNDLRHAHRDAVIPLAFLSIPKCSTKFSVSFIVSHCFF